LTLNGHLTECGLYGHARLPDIICRGSHENKSRSQMPSGRKKVDMLILIILLLLVLGGGGGYYGRSRWGYRGGAGTSAFRIPISSIIRSDLAQSHLVVVHKTSCADDAAGQLASF